MGYDEENREKETEETKDRTGLVIGGTVVAGIAIWEIGKKLVHVAKDKFSDFKEKRELKKEEKEKEKKK